MRPDPYRHAEPVEPRDIDGALGAVVSVHSGIRKRPFILAALLVVVLPIVIVVVRGFAWERIVVGVLTAVLFSCSFGGVALAGGPRRVVLHEFGVRRWPWWGESTEMRFDACVAVHYDYMLSTGIMGTGVTHLELTLKDQRGRTLLIPAVVADADQILKAIDEHCVVPVIHEAERAFQDGETMAFGALSVSNDGIVFDESRYAWSDVKRVEISPKGFWFHLNGRFRSKYFSFEKTPHPFALVAILRQTGRELRFIEGFADAPR